MSVVSVPQPVSPSSTSPNTVPIGNRLNPTQVDNQLTLANGMTAGFGVGDHRNDNPKVAPGTYGGNPLYAPIRIGFLRSLPGALPGNTQYTLYFMFNPNQVTSQFQMNVNQAAPLYMYGSSDQSSATSFFTGGTPTSNSSVPNLANSQTIAWTLFFDRTYDMLYGVNGGDPKDDRGVLKDVAALYNLMGTFETAAAVPVSVPCEVVFGQNGAGQLWGFTGYIAGVTITYGIFRHDMIPARCEVDLTMQCTYVSPQVPSTTVTIVNPTTGINSNGGVGLVPEGPPQPEFGPQVPG